MLSLAKKLASERLKMEIAQELGFADVIRQHGWQAVTTQEVGLMVKEMIRRGEESLVNQRASTYPQPGDM